MTEVVYDSFDYANILVDYENKDVKVTYPYTTPKYVEFILFGCIGSWYILPTWLVFYLFDMPVWIATSTLIIAYGLWYHYAYTYPTIRKKIIKIPMKNDVTRDVTIIGESSSRVVLSNAGNYCTSYELYGDYKNIKSFEVKCVECVNDGKYSFWRWHNARYRWELHFVFYEPPKRGKMVVRNTYGESDLIDDDAGIVVAQR